MDQQDRESVPANGLTPIPGRIHCAATADSGDFNNEYDELEQLAIDHFLETLASIAVAVAARTIASAGGELDCEP